ILINSRFAFILTSLIGANLFALSFMQMHHVYAPRLYWKHQEYNLADGIVRYITLTIIALVSWLFNREMETALIRAQLSEKALREQRDLLEIKVEERTQELKQTQVEKLTQLYRFAEFGKISSGLFHDLVT